MKEISIPEEDSVNSTKPISLFFCIWIYNKVFKNGVYLLKYGRSCFEFSKIKMDKDKVQLYINKGLKFIGTPINKFHT